MQQPLQRLAGELRQIRCAQQHGIRIPGILHAQMNGMGHSPLDLAVQNGLKARFFCQRIDPFIADHRHSTRTWQAPQRFKRMGNHRSALIERKQLVFSPKPPALPRRQQNDAQLHASFSFSPRRIFSGVMGRFRILTPHAWNTASAMAGAGVLMTHSPMDFAPNGPVGS